MRRSNKNRLCLPVAALLLAINVQAYEWNIEPWGAPLPGPAPETLEFSGLWPDSCTPRPDSIRLTGDTLEMRTISAHERCVPSETLFSVPVQLLPENSGAIKIAWFHRRDNETIFQLYGHRLRSPETYPSLEPSSGWWWPEPDGPVASGGPGTGLTVDYQQGLLTILSQAYDALGNPQWQLAAGALEGEIFNSPLILFSNGQTLTGDYRLPDLIAGRDELSLHFHSALSATAWFSHRRGSNLDSPIDLRTVSMIRYVINPPVLERLLIGRWLVTSRRDPDNAAAVVAMRINSIEQKAPGEIRLFGPSGAQIGRCRLDPDRPEAAPVECSVTGLGRFGDITIDSVGYDRMEGSDQNGRRVLAVRIPL